jgi:hypothetical protein
MRRATRQRDVTGRRFAPNSFGKRTVMHFYNEQEPDNVNETPSLNFAVAAAGGDIGNRPRGLDHFGQKLLAKRGQAGRAHHNRRTAEQITGCVRIQHDAGR